MSFLDANKTWLQYMNVIKHNYLRKVIFKESFLLHLRVQYYQDIMINNRYVKFIISFFSVNKSKEY